MRIPVCNGRPSTAPALAGIRFPLCWRCTAAILAAGLVELTGIPITATSASAGVALFALGGADGIRSYTTIAGTTNFNRVVFGALLGAGAFLCTAYAAQCLINQQMG